MTGRRRNGGLLAALILLLPFSLLVMPTTMLVIPAMVPTIVAFIVDRDPEKAACVSVGAMNFCGVMPFLIQLWREGHTSETAFAIMADPTTWLVVYGAAAAGWGIYYLVPTLVVGLGAARAEARIRELESECAILVEDWGPEVAGRNMAEPGEKKDTESGDGDPDEAPSEPTPAR